MPIEVRTWQCFIGLKQEVKNILIVLPLINNLHSKYMKDRHWKELKVATGRNFIKDETFCLANLLDLQLHKHVTEVEYIVQLASQENKIASQLTKIHRIWESLAFEFKAHNKYPDILLIQSPDDILISLEESSAMLQSMQGQGKYVEHFIDDVNKWQKALSRTETVLEDWLEVQKAWTSFRSYIFRF